MLVGFTGVGGGSLMTPLLVLLFGIHPATAVGTDLLYAGLTKICGSAVHGFNDAIDWRVLRRLALGSIPATAVTLLVLAHFGVDSKGASTTITTTLGFALIVTALTLVFRRRFIKAAGYLLDNRTDGEIGALTIGLGVVLGVLVSITSVGAGAIGATVLLTLYPKMPTVRIVGTDIAHAVPLTLSGRRRPLVARLGRLGASRFVACRLDSGHHDRKPLRRARARSGAASAHGRDFGAGRRQARPLSRSAANGSMNGAG